MTVQTYIAAVRAASNAASKAWEVSLADLAGANEGTVTKYFEAATAILLEAKVPKDDSRRVMVRNHKSNLLGLLKRGGKIEKGLGKSKVEADNREARKGAKGPTDAEDKAKDDGSNPETGLINAVAYIVKHWQAVPSARLLSILAPLHDLIARTYTQKKAA